jgi:hypothetical protein
VYADRDAKIGRHFVDRKIIRARKRPAAELVWAPENPHEPEFLFGVAQLLNRARRILQRNKTDAVKPLPIVTAIIRQPGVIGAADGGAELGVEVVAPHNVETEGREEHAYVDAFSVHVTNVGWGIELGG